ncbi:MAG: phosphate transport regulator, partial [Chloroflexi bacterium RBG_13_57_8]
PTEHKFFDLFEESAKNILKASKSLKEMLDTWQFVDSRVAEITELEHEGDSITHQIISLLHRTFVTPFDREDIALLAHTMDDIIDFIHASADSMFIYKINSPAARAKELADIIVLGAVEVEKAVGGLRHKSEFKQILERCVEINRLENMADRVYRAAIGELFENTADIAQIIKWREIYEHMESATDRAEDVADVLEGVALKNA